MAGRTILLTAAMLASVLMGASSRAQTPAGDQGAGRASNTFVAERRQDQWLASSLKNKNVYDRSDTKIGVINDLVIAREGRVAGVVIGVGGFLGIGEKNVAVPFDDIKIAVRDNNEWFVLDRSRDDLKAAPSFGGAGAPGSTATTSEQNFGTLNAPPPQDGMKTR